MTIVGISKYKQIILAHNIDGESEGLSLGIVFARIQCGKIVESA